MDEKRQILNEIKKLRAEKDEIYKKIRELEGAARDIRKKIKEQQEMARCSMRQRPVTEEFDRKLLDMRSRIVRELAKREIPRRQIAEILGVSPNLIYVILRKSKSKDLVAH